MASGNWILSLDADERISQPLRQEIIDTLKQTQADAFAIPRHSYYCGKIY